MKYIKDFDSWMSENYPSSNDNPPSQVENKELTSDISDLMFSFFDGGEDKYKNRLADFNDKYDTDLALPKDWTSLTVLDDPERIYLTIGDFVKSYDECVV